MKYGVSGGAAPMLAEADPAIVGVATEVAVTVAWPATVARSRPLPSIVPSVCGVSDHRTARLVASVGSTVAENCCIWPTVSCALAGATVTDRTAIPRSDGTTTLPLLSHHGQPVAITHAPRNRPSEILRLAIIGD